MPRKGCFFSSRAGGHLNKPTRAAVDYDKLATKEMALLLSFWRWYPDILEDVALGERPGYTNSLMNRVTKRYMARYQETFTYACRGYGKTTCIVSDKCNKGIMWPGEITGYYAPSEKQAAPLASKAFADYKRNYPILAQHWNVDSEAQSSFKLSTPHGSKFIMDIDRGIDTSGVVAEECAQEDKFPFNWTDFNQIVLGTNRLDHKVNGESDLTHIDSQIHYITSCSRKENEAFTVYKDLRQSMTNGESAFAISIPWQVPVLCRMKRYGYYQMLKKKLTAEQFDRECNSKCTGAVDNPIIRDDVLRASRKVMVMEDRHCGDPDVFYILGYDVSSRDHAGNALSALSVIKCEKQYGFDSNHYRKSLVYVQDMRPPKTAKEHAILIKRRWHEYCLTGNTAYVVVDARNYGQSVVECLHEDLNDGLPPFCTMDFNPDYAGIVLPGALPILYAIQAGGMNGKDPNSVMLDYIEREYERGNLQMLTENLSAGLKAYKLKHGIKDDLQDAWIQFPYLKTNRLCRQVANLKKKYTVSGWIEQEISHTIEKDMWSATLYACRVAQNLERENLSVSRRSASEWEIEARAISGSGYTVHTKSNKRMGRLAIK